MKIIITYLFACLSLIALVLHTSPISARELLAFAIFDIPRFQPIRSSAQQQSRDNLQLQVYLSNEKAVSDKQIRWNIMTAKGKVFQQLIGNQQSLRLPEGDYQVELLIGAFSSVKAVSLKQNRLIKPYFKAFLGNQKSTTAYVQQPQPMGQVELAALRKNQPLFNSLSWEIYRLESGEKQPIGRYHLHTQRITVPTGLYVAVANYEGIERSRQFWVKQGVTNQVVLAMD